MISNGRMMVQDDLARAAQADRPGEVRTPDLAKAAEILGRRRRARPTANG